MTGDLKVYFGAICIPALFVTLAGMFLLVREARLDARQAFAARCDRAEVLAGEFQDAVRDAAPAVRTVAAAGWTGGTGVPCARFTWEPRRGVTWDTGCPPALKTRLSAFRRWNEWTAFGKKSARRGVMEETCAPWSILWARVDDAVWGVVYAASPVPMRAGFSPWLACSCLCVLFAVATAAGGILLFRAARRARRDDLTKTTFVSNVSHELKTPLAAIRLWVDLLRKGTLATEEKRRKACEVIANENARMTRLVENLLDFSRLDRGRRSYVAEEVDLGDLAREAAEVLHDDFEAYGLAVEAPEGLVACTDADAVRQIVVNLLGNAAKYAAAQGPVELAVARDDAGFRLTVADRGPGLPPASLPRVFERFWRADDELTATTGGLGLGLSISRALARELGGDLLAAARPGGGLVFTLVLPARMPQRA